MKKSVIFIIGILFLVSLFFFGCEEEDETMTVQGRVDNFLSDLNSDTTRTSIYENLHSSISAAWASAAVWEATYFASGGDDNLYLPFAYGGLSYGANSASGVIHNAVDTTDRNIDFILQEDGEDNWKITQVSVSGIGTIIQ